jgi:hypothetical protein
VDPAAGKVVVKAARPKAGAVVRREAMGRPMIRGLKAMEGHLAAADHRAADRAIRTSSVIQA